VDAVTPPKTETATAEEMRAADGRVPGRRGRATRQRLIECTLDSLKTTSYRELKVVDIAREAGTSPATFYQYFPDVEAAILVIAEEMAKDGTQLSDLVRDASWKGKAGYASAVALAGGFMDFWETNRSVLRVVDLAIEEGDERFHQIRVRLLNGITVAMSEVGRGHRGDIKRHRHIASLFSRIHRHAVHRIDSAAGSHSRTDCRVDFCGVDFGRRIVPATGCFLTVSRCGGADSAAARRPPARPRRRRGPCGADCPVTWGPAGRPDGTASADRAG
jgi:AcrR family transcriptional regulator